MNKRLSNKGIEIKINQLKSYIDEIESQLYSESRETISDFCNDKFEKISDCEKLANKKNFWNLFQRKLFKFNDLSRF